MSLTGVVGSANAAESRSALPQRASVTTDLGNNGCAFSYWIDEAMPFTSSPRSTRSLASTPSPEHGRHAVVRFSALILPGQSQVISVPGPVGCHETP
jgi:hypothetical protein